jgi:hypothetical protein
MAEKGGKVEQTSVNGVATQGNTESYSSAPSSAASASGTAAKHVNSQTTSSAHVVSEGPVCSASSPSSPGNFGSLVAFSVSKKLDVSAHFDGIATGVLGILLVAGSAYRYWRLRSGRVSDFELNEAEFGLGQQKIKLKVNDDDRQIAYKIWVELSTRKIGLKIDLEQDVITEVYDSWHTFFSVTRELIKDVPVRKYQRDSTATIVRLSIEVLNEGLRPHLTKWQARFRRWYEHAASQANAESTSPQEIQRAFPAFEELAADLMLVNQQLIAYRTRMHDLITQR